MRLQALAKPPGELPDVLERLVSHAAPGSVEREEALWFAGEASQAYQYFSTAGAEWALQSGLGPKHDWPAQPEYYDQLLNVVFMNPVG